MDSNESLNSRYFCKLFSYQSITKEAFRSVLKPWQAWHKLMSRHMAQGFLQFQHLS